MKLADLRRKGSKWILTIMKIKLLGVLIENFRELIIGLYYRELFWARVMVHVIVQSTILILLPKNIHLLPALNTKPN